LVELPESYLDLNASDILFALHRDLVDVQDPLQYAGGFYNAAVRDYNDAVQRVPDLLVARLFGFGEREFYQAEAEQRAAVRVRLP